MWTEFLISNLKLHIDVSITKRNYLWQITLLTVLIGGIGGWAYYSVFPHHYFGGYPLIPIFFLTFGVFMINMVESCRHRMPGRMLQIYLLMRVMRLLASIIVMLVYCVAVREEAKEFLLTFIVNYLIYLIYDSWFFFTFEANRKLKKKKRKENETLRNILTGALLVLGALSPAVVQADSIPVTQDGLVAELDSMAQRDDVTPAEQEKNTVDVKEIVFGHIGDSYEWHITAFGETQVIIPLPVILYSSTTGWHAFLSSRLEENGGSYEGFSIAPEGSKYEGKLVEYDDAGNEVRPWDISITKVTLALLINSVLLLVIILSVAQWYRKHPQGSAAPGGFIGFMEMFIMMVNDDIIKSCVGPKYRKFAPYLLTAFFFIFINNLMGLIPIFPGGANVTGNIAITMVLAVCTFLAVNIFGTKAYWKDIFWPDVPWWLKVPVPMMPFIEFFGIFTKPFALMIRLFANMLAGHMAMLVLTCLIFISASMGPALNGTLTVASVLFNIFMNALELLVAFIQAYVFTMLSAVFIGLAQEEHKEKAEEKVMK